MEQMFDVLALANEGTRLEQEQQRARQRSIGTQAEKLRQALGRVIGRIAQAQAGEFEYEWDKYRDVVVRGWQKVEVPGVLPFYVVVKPAVVDGQTEPIYFTSHAPDDRSIDRHRVVSAPVDDPAQVAALMKRQREGWLQQQAAWQKATEEQVAKEMQDIRARLTANPHWSKAFQSEAEALAGLQRLKKYHGPEQFAELEALFAGWQEGRAELAREVAAKAEQKRQDEAARAQYAQQLADYQAVFAAYWGEKEMIEAANALRVEALQARWNEPYQIYELTYALVAVDGDEGERYLDTKTVTCLYPAEDGFQRVLKNGKIKMVQVQHPVWWSQPQPIRPTDPGSHAPGIDIGNFTGGYEQEIRYPPLADREAVARDIAATMTEIPAEPPQPGELTWKDLKTVRGKVMSDDPNYTCPGDW